MCLILRDTENKDSQLARKTDRERQTYTQRKIERKKERQTKEHVKGLRV